MSDFQGSKVPGLANVSYEEVGGTKEDEDDEKDGFDLNCNIIKLHRGIYNMCCRVISAKNDYARLRFKLLDAIKKAENSKTLI